MIYYMDPCTKPRMTRGDEYQKVPRGNKYRAFKQEVRLRGITLPDSAYHIIFYISMPPSWGKKKKEKMDGMAHQQTPDKDNLEKALMDAVFDDDKKIWDGRVSKVWSYEGAIEVLSIEPLETPRKLGE